MGLNELKKQAASNGYTRRVTVAVVDTGIDTSNVLFAGRKVSSQSYNFFGNNHNVQDTFGLWYPCKWDYRRCYAGKC